MSTKKELIVRQVLFWVLMAGGSTLTAACEAAGCIEQLAVNGAKRQAG